MNLNFGLNGSMSVQAARPILVNSTTAIGILGAAATMLGLHKFNNADDALVFLADNGIAGDVENALKGIALQGVVCPIVLNLCDALLVLDAMNEFKKSEGLTGVSLMGGLLIAPVLSADVAVGAKLDAVAAVTLSTALIDNFDAVEADIVNWAANFGTRTSLLCHGSYTADGVAVACSALYAGLIAHWDSKPFGWAKSHSNRIVKGVSAAAHVVEYVEGSDCEARRLRQKGVAMILRDTGWRTYGFETTDIDIIWQSLDRIRAFHRLLQAILQSSKWARDREANELIWVKQSIVEFMNELKGNDVIIGFEAFFDPDKNTKATVTAGKFYLTVLLGDMPSVRELNIELVYSDQWNDVLINYINGEAS
ncbi:MAG: hypothetical protein JKY87_04560 [Mariprofundus sp.]|nr:hypothetical protein [Mariprofundus sp.]